MKEFDLTEIDRQSGQHWLRGWRQFKDRPARRQAASEIKFFDPDQPRDDHGRWTSDGGSVGTTEGDKLVDEDEAPPQRYERPKPIVVKSVEEAVPLVLAGKVVELDDAGQAHTLIEKLADMAKAAAAAGQEAPEYDLCNVSVKGTNLFCAESYDVPRLKMPQFSGTPLPGTPADALSRNSRGEVDGTQLFMHYLKNLGIGAKEEMVPSHLLRASQRELVGQKVAGIMRAGLDPTIPIFVSRDNYVIDGHHRWAATVGQDAADGHLGDSHMRTIRVDAPITEVLHLANRWMGDFGLKAKGTSGKEKG